MIRLDGITKSYGGQNLFDNLNWQIPDARKVGLVGPNGAGKTTLFRVMVGIEEADSGDVIIPRHVQVGYLPQELVGDDTGALIDVILSGRQDLIADEQRLRDMEAVMSGTPDTITEQLTNDYSLLQEKFRREGGYTFRSHARELAVGMGFKPTDFETPIESFSGGWQMRALLCRLLLQKPNVLLLDEPTNHLDLESIEWLENYLSNYDGTVIVISHDRYFLNGLIDQVAELAHASITVYHGNYDQYLGAREQRREQTLAMATQQQKEIDKIERFVERFRSKATKASQVQSRVKQLEKMERVEVLPDNTAKIAFQFPQPPRTGKSVLQGRELSKAFGDNVIFQGVDFELLRGDKVAIVGPNGAGKSTLLKMLAGKLEPDRGAIEVGHRVELAYFAQHAVDQLDINRTVFEEMNSAASYDVAPRVRGLLGAFLFSGNDVDKPISVLSGGEKSRLALAKMLLEPAGCMLLDEPTNHLDIPSCQMLEQALIQYEGAFCVISHDRYFLNKVVNKVIHVEGGQLTIYDGDYDYYRYKRTQELELESTSDDSFSAPDDGGAISRKDQRRLLADLRKERATKTDTLRKQVATIEKNIEEAEVAHAELEQLLASPDTYDNADNIGKLNKQYQHWTDVLEKLMVEWESVGAKLDEIDQEFAKKEAAIRNDS